MLQLYQLFSFKFKPTLISLGHDTLSQQQRERQEAAQRLRQLNIPGVEVFTPDDFSDLTAQEQEVCTWDRFHVIT